MAEGKLHSILQVTRMIGSFSVMKQADDSPRLQHFIKFVAGNLPVQVNLSDEGGIRVEHGSLQPLLAYDYKYMKYMACCFRDSEQVELAADKRSGFLWCSF